MWHFVTFISVMSSDSPSVQQKVFITSFTTHDGAIHVCAHCRGGGHGKRSDHCSRPVLVDFVSLLSLSLSAPRATSHAISGGVNVTHVLHHAKLEHCCKGHRVTHAHLHKARALGLTPPLPLIVFLSLT